MKNGNVKVYLISVSKVAQELSNTEKQPNVFGEVVDTKLISNKHGFIKPSDFDLLVKDCETIHNYETNQLCYITNPNLEVNESTGLGVYTADYVEIVKVLTSDDKIQIAKLKK